MAQPIHLGPFVLGDPLGSGGTATVYAAVHEPSGTAAAVKVVRLSPERSPVRNNLATEVRAVVALDHPHIVQVYDVGEVDPAAADASDGRLLAGTPWYAMELARDGSLRQRLRTLDWPELLQVLLDLLDALAHAHARGVLHLDLKPGNVLFGGARPGAKLGDFGMGLVGPADPSEDFVRGTPQFMAPEQVRGRWEELGPWTDLYALGCLSWRCLTGEVPFVRRSSREVLEAHVFREQGPFRCALDAPPGIEGWVRRLLNKDPERRFRFAADASAALRELAGRPGEPRGPDWRVSEQDGPAEVSSVIGLGLAAVREPPVVGRTREREQLWDALRRAVAGEVQLVVLRGPHGVGKSRLAGWLGVRAHELGLGVVLSAGHHPDPRPQDGVLGALRAEFPTDPRSAEAEVELGTLLHTRGLSAPAARDAAALLVHGGRGETPSGRAWNDAVSDALQAVAAERTPVGILDDAQWGGDSLECVLSLVRSGRMPPSVWVLAVDETALADRPAEDELLAAILALPQARVVPLGPLSEQASAVLSRRMLALEPSVSAEIARRSAGMPGLQIELVHDWARRGLLEPGPDGFVLRDGPSGDGVGSERLEALVAGRPGWRRALQVAAILGPLVDGAEWQAACAALGREAPRNLLLELLRARLARRVDHGSRVDRWLFAEPALRDVVVGWAETDGVAAEVHRACAAVVHPSEDERRGRHLIAAGRPDEALPLLLRALDQAVDTGRSGALLALIDPVAPEGGPERAELEEHRAALLLATGRPEEARAAAERQRAAAGDDPARLFAAVANLARAALELGDQAEALAAEAELQAALSRDPTLILRAWVLSSQAERAGRRVEAARAVVEWASLLVVPRRAALELLLERVQVALAGGRTETARLGIEQLAAGAGAAGARWLGAAAALAAGDRFLLVGDPERALEEYATARRRFRALGHADEGLAQAGLAVALVAAGRPEEAALALERAVPRGAPRHAVRRAVAEVVVRAGDLAWPSLWREVRKLLDSPVAGLDPGIRPMLQLAAAATPRPERARELRGALESLDQPPASA